MISGRTLTIQPGKTQNPLHVSFKNTQWPPNFITPENVLDYFCNPANTFYDRGSCNQVLRMQKIDRPIEECLQTLTGIQYIVWHSQPPLFIICKQRRNNQTNVTPLAYYYVVNGLVLQAPDLYSVLQSRLLGALEPLSNAFKEVSNYSRYNAAKGYYWEFRSKQGKRKDDDDKSDNEEKPLEERSTNFQKSRTAMLLNQIIGEMPPEEAMEPEDEELPAGTEKDENRRDGSVKEGVVFAEPAAKPDKK